MGDGLAVGYSCMYGKHAILYNVLVLPELEPTTTLRPCVRLPFKCVLYCGTSVLIYALKFLNGELYSHVVGNTRTVWALGSGNL